MEPQSQSSLSPEPKKASALKFVKKVVIAILLIVVGFVLGTYASMLSERREEQKTVSTNSTTAARTITGNGFEATAPTSWKVDSQTNSYVSLSSANYVAKSRSEIMQAEMQGEATGVVKQGAMIEIVPQGENPLSASIQDPTTYVRFRMEGNYSNEIENKEISLGGQPAWLLKTRRSDGTLMTTVNTVRNGKEFFITLHAANESSIDSATWNAFLSSFKFR